MIRLGLLSLLMISTICSGCARSKIVLHPIEQTDIVMLKQGEQLIAPKQGAFLSDEYISQVMRARVEK